MSYRSRQHLADHVGGNNHDTTPDGLPCFPGGASETEVSPTTNQVSGFGPLAHGQVSRDRHVRAGLLGNQPASVMARCTMRCSNLPHTLALEPERMRRRDCQAIPCRTMRPLARWFKVAEHPGRTRTSFRNSSKLQNRYVDPTPRAMQFRASLSRALHRLVLRHSAQLALQMFVLAQVRSHEALP